MDDTPELEYSIRRSKAAYNRIKMYLPPRQMEKSTLPVEHKQSVERINQVLSILEAIDLARKIDKAHRDNKAHQSYSEQKETYLQLTTIRQILRDIKTSSVIKKIYSDTKRIMKELEESLDTHSFNLLKEAISSGSSHWDEYLVRKDKKRKLFVFVFKGELEKKYVPDLFKSTRLTLTRPLTETIKDLAENAFGTLRTREIIELCTEMIHDKIDKGLSNRLYSVVKSLDPPSHRLKQVSELVDRVNRKIFYLTGTKEIGKNSKKILKSVYTTLFSDAENVFISSKVNENTLYDSSLHDFLGSLAEVDRHPDLFDGWSQKRKMILKQVLKISMEKGNRINGKIKASIFNLNAYTLLRRTGYNHLPKEKDLVLEVISSLRNTLIKEVESPRKKKNATSTILTYIEHFAQVSKKYILSHRYRKTITEEYKKDVREIASKHGSLDDISDSHLSSLIDNLFKGHKPKRDTDTNSSSTSDTSESETKETNEIIVLSDDSDKLTEPAPVNKEEYPELKVPVAHHKNTTSKIKQPQAQATKTDKNESSKAPKASKVSKAESKQKEEKKKKNDSKSEEHKQKKETKQQKYPKESRSLSN
ncbi:hypothetical protein NEOKW01_1759 [Nematocida sp. AWRm80]|nr:hypothetical protein NEOKW01_1759 [Nematocida sp. AWRm80]